MEITFGNYFWKFCLKSELVVAQNEQSLYFLGTKLASLKLFCLDTISVFGKSPFDSEDTIFYILMIKTFEICETN